MFDKNTFIQIIDNIIRLGARFKEKNIEHATPNLPPAKLMYFEYNAQAHTFILYLTECIKKDKELSNLFNNKQYNYGMIYFTFSPINLIEWLIAASITHNSKTAVDTLSKFVKLGYTPAYKFLSISGMKIDKEIKINERINILPLHSLRPTYQKFTSGPK